MKFIIELLWHKLIYISFTPQLIGTELAWWFFLVGQIIEGNYLTPRFVGRSMGIHPVWLIISLAFFGKIGGITGLILALPITAILGVLAKHILKVYYSSAFFNSKGT